MNGFQHFLHVAGAALSALFSAMYGTASAVFAGQSAPARQVALCTLAAVVLLLFAPRILKKITK